MSLPWLLYFAVGVGLMLFLRGYHTADSPTRTTWPAWALGVAIWPAAAAWMVTSLWRQHGYMARLTFAESLLIRAFKLMPEGEEKRRMATILLSYFKLDKRDMKKETA